MAVETLRDLDAFSDGITVPDTLAEFVPQAPDFVSPGWVVDTYGIRSSTVYSAIKDGRLPALAVPGSKGAVSYLLRPQHVFALWGGRYITRSLTQDKS